MRTEQNKQTVREFFEHFSATNVSAALDLLDDAVIWRVMGNEGGLPMSGEMDKQVIGSLISSIKEAIPAGMKLKPTGWTAEGDRVALEMESYGEMSNGKVYNNHYHFLVTLSGNKITALREVPTCPAVPKPFFKIFNAALCSRSVVEPYPVAIDTHN